MWLQVLRFMHKHNIVHRDLKPDNFCLPYGSNPYQPAETDTVYVVDMGMAQQINPNSKASSCVTQIRGCVHGMQPMIECIQWHARLAAAHTVCC